MTTFPELLQQRLARDPGRPFVTFYDEATGERTELSVTTYANWVAKVANLFLDELMLEPGDAVAVDLPPHWLGPVLTGALLTAGLEREGADAGVHVVGPDPVAVPGATTLACALRPFAVRYPEPLPAGVLDFGVLWPGQPDAMPFAMEPTTLDVPEPSDERVLTDTEPTTDELLALLAGAGSLVLLVNAGDDQWPARSESERATVTRRATKPENQPIA